MSILQIIFLVCCALATGIKVVQKKPFDEWVWCVNAAIWCVI